MGVIASWSWGLVACSVSCFIQLRTHMHRRLPPVPGWALVAATLIGIGWAGAAYWHRSRIAPGRAREVMGDPEGPTTPSN